MLLPEKIKQPLLNIFATLNFPLEVLAYGSRVTGTAHPGSDLELVLRLKDGKAMPFLEYADLCERIKEIEMPISVSLKDWASQSSSFQKKVANQLEVFYSKG